MTSFAPDETLRELDDETRRAWDHYSDQLRELSGAQYERAESESWEELQDELRRVEVRRERFLAACGDARAE